MKTFLFLYALLLLHSVGEGHCSFFLLNTPLGAAKDIDVNNRITRGQQRVMGETTQQEW